MLYLLSVLIIAASAIVFAARRGRNAPRTGLAGRISVFGSLAVLVPYLFVFLLPLAYLAERLIPGLRIPSPAPFSYQWWAYPLPVAAAIVTVFVALLALRRAATAPEVPVVPLAPRGWSTFTKRRDLVAAIVSAGVLVAVSVAAGLASVTDDAGLHTLIEFPGPELNPGESPGVGTFYGWAYSVPLMVGVVALAILMWLALRASALPAFRRPESVEAETRDREAVASALLRLATAAVLLPLGGALVQIGDAGMGSTGFGIPGVGDFMWSLGYASFAPAINALGFVVQVVGALLLLRSILAGRRAAVPVPVAAS